MHQARRRSTREADNRAWDSPVDNQNRMSTGDAEAGLALGHQGTFDGTQIFPWRSRRCQNLRIVRARCDSHSVVRNALLILLMGHRLLYSATMRREKPPMARILCICPALSRLSVRQRAKRVEEQGVGVSPYDSPYNQAGAGRQSNCKLRPSAADKRGD